MKSHNRLAKSILGLTLLTASASYSHAALIATMTEAGNDVVVVLNGTVNLAGLSSAGLFRFDAGFTPSNPSIGFGESPSTGIFVTRYSGVTQPASFGAGVNSTFDLGTGDRVVLLANSIFLSPSYVSGNALSASNTFSNASISSLGANPGTYTWNWGSNANADFFELTISTAAAVPAPATGILFVSSLLALAWRRRSVQKLKQTPKIIK